MSMAASAADVRSILSLSGPSTPQMAPKKPQAPSTRKPEGISRELYSLIGPSAPSLAAQLAKPRLKQKPNLGGGGKVKWECRSFKNPARADSLELKHWVKESASTAEEYPFAKYNVATTKYSYTEEEYNNHLTDEQWTKAETDYLFQLVENYDLRWYVVFDRYQFPEGSLRTLEDIKDRYYSVCRKLVRSQPWNGDEASKNAVITSLHFDKDRENLRKRYLTNLDNRTAEQIAEEEALFIEIKRLEQNERKFKRDREDLLRTLAGIDSGLPDIVEDDISSIQFDLKRKNKKGGYDILDSPSTPSMVPPAIKRQPPQNAKSAAYDAQHCIIRTEMSATMPATKAAHTLAYPRSYKLPVPKAAIAPKVTQALAELGISHTRLVMPTKDNVARLDSLLDATVNLIDMKKNVDKLEYDINVAKGRLGIQTSSKGEEEEERPEDGMDVDDDPADEASTDGGRAQSVMSTKSGRGRKNRRSMSISSVDTTATSSRAGTKRQKRS